MIKEASFWIKIKNDRVQCKLCNHNCKLSDGKYGICGVRKNVNGKLLTLIYGSVSSFAVDPIEKKPLYHFYPGTSAFSIGSIGCNFKCSHCQNYSISTANPDYFNIKNISPDQVVEYAKNYDCKGVSYTYNEPTIWHEFTYNSSKLVKKAGLYTCYVTNGYICEDPLREISHYLDAMNIDVKSFNNEFYRDICKAKLEPVLNTCILAKELGIHIELTYLVIPGLNDSIKDIKKFCNWVINELDKNTPVHFSRFHPDHDMTDIPATPIETLLKIYDISKESGMLFSYLGNVIHGYYENTLCPSCGNLCIERNGYLIKIVGLIDNKCSKCGYKLPILFDIN
jgi:pyruvate formate lyase activating enzyme